VKVLILVQSHQVFLVNHLDRLNQQRLFLAGPTQQPSNQSTEVKTCVSEQNKPLKILNIQKIMGKVSGHVI